MKKGIFIAGKKSIFEITIKGGKKFWKFLKEFGDEFAVEGIKNIRSPQDYSKEPDGYHVFVVISPDEEEKFRSFLTDFNNQK